MTLELAPHLDTIEYRGLLKHVWENDEYDLRASNICDINLGLPSIGKGLYAILEHTEEINNNNK
jgi:hypothetical protein